MTFSPAAFDPRRIGARLRAAREERGLSQVALRDASGVAESTICALEKGRWGGNVATLWALCRALGCSADEVLGLKPPSYPVREQTQTPIS